VLLFEGFNCTERYGIDDYQIDTIGLSSKNELIGTVMGA
jgi:hypothetical protein